MNIQKLEVVLNEMRRASFDDAALAETLVRKWADQIDAAISEHLIAELEVTAGPGASAAPELSAEPRGPGWDESD